MKERPSPEISVIERNSIPAIDRAMAVFGVLESRPEGVAIRDLVTELGLPRTTVYRTLNSLEMHEVVHRNADGTYRLGPRLLSLAAKVVQDDAYDDIVTWATPHMRRISKVTGQSCKLSVRQNLDAVALATTTGNAGASIAVAPGQTTPLHAGAAGKVFLASLSDAEVSDLLPDPLPVYTPQTIAARSDLIAQLAQIRAQGWAEDRGEYTTNVEAYAAGVKGSDGRPLAVLSIPFLSGIAQDERELLKSHALTGAGAIAADRPRRRR